MAERFPWWPFPIPGDGDRGDGVYRTPTGEPLNEPGEPIDPEDLFDLVRPPPAAEPAEPPPDPQIGVEEVPPPNTDRPAPLPNPRGEYGGVYVPPPPPQPRRSREEELREGARRYAEREYDFEEFCGDYELTRSDCQRFRWIFDAVDPIGVPPLANPSLPTPTRGLGPAAFRSSPREAGPTRPRASRDIPALLVGIGPKSFARSRPRVPRSRSSPPATQLAFRGPRPQRTEGYPGAPFPQTYPFPTRVPGRKRVERRTLPDFETLGQQRPPWPTPDEMAPYPVAPPRPPVRTIPRIESPLEVPSPRIPEPGPVTQPRLPDPVFPHPTLPAPLPKTPPRRNKPAAPARPRAKPAPARVPRVLTRVAQLGALSILRPILRRKNRQTTGFQEFLQPRPLEVAPPARIQNPLEERLQPEPLDPRLTPIQGTALGFAPQQLSTPQARRQRDEECVCEETAEEKEESRERNRSNVVASVKPYRRRMSQNSLDNLRKG